jgi:NAD(P)-dependent dehydrogenase (short-subunit alcohol dehydrogenase family)
MFFLVFWTALIGFITYKLLFSSPVKKIKTDIDPQGKWVLVTGAASGIGKEICLHLLKRGARVIACDINMKGLEENFASNPNVTCVHLDVSSPEHIAKTVPVVQQALNGERLFGCVNNAGVGVPFPLSGLLEKGEKELEVLIGVNLLGVIRCSSAFYPLMKHEANKQNPGALINMASQAGWISAPFWGWYSTTKHGVVAYTDSVRRELKFKTGTPEYIRVTCVCPGFANTPIINYPKTHENTTYREALDSMLRSMENRPFAFQDPDVVADMVCDCIFSTQNPAHLHAESKLIYRINWRLCRTLPVSAVDCLFTKLLYK